MSVPVEKDPRDTRDESWKIVGSKSEWETLSDKVQVHGKFPQSKRLELVENLVDDCVQTVDAARRSLGIVRPHIRRYYISDRSDYRSDVQSELFGGPPVMTKENYPIQPRIEYRCSGCKSKGDHDQQVIEWGFYEWFRKHPNNPEQVWKNARVTDPEYVKYLLVGNQFLYRSSFLIVEIFRFEKRLVSKPLIPFRKIADPVNPRP